MTVRWLLAALHLIALGIGLGAIWARASALRGELTEHGLRRAFAADTWWGVAALILALEVLPMVTLIRWRRTMGRAEQPDRSIAPSLARISYIQAGLVVAMVIAAAGMARGVGQ